MNQIQKIFLMSAAMLTATTATIPAPAQLSSNVHVWVTGLNGPRGLKFGPNGSLYVAEAGTGGTISTAGRCGQVIPPVGPYKGGNTARISRIDSAGQRTTLASGLPSSVDAFGDLPGCRRSRIRRRQALCVVGRRRLFARQSFPERAPQRESAERILDDGCQSEQFHQDAFCAISQPRRF